jgi:alkyldihydroxyacetonephosphate synthase
MSGARLKHYGWGREHEGMTAEEQAFVLGRYHTKFARDTFETKAVPRLEDLALRAPRVALPASLAAFCMSERYDRVAHGLAVPTSSSIRSATSMFAQAVRN